MDTCYVVIHKDTCGYRDQWGGACPTGSCGGRPSDHSHGATPAGRKGQEEGAAAARSHRPLPTEASALQRAGCVENVFMAEEMGRPHAHARMYVLALCKLPP